MLRPVRMLRDIGNLQRFLFLRAVVDDPVDHIQVVFHHHFRIAKRIFRRNEIRQLLKTKAVGIVACDLSLLLQDNDVTDTEAVAVEVFRTIQIEFGVETFKDRSNSFDRASDPLTMCSERQKL